MHATNTGTDVLVNDCTFSSHFGTIEKVKDCGRTDCPHSDNYEN
jgi:hypothetical protein